jgi:hypothetical protein
MKTLPKLIGLDDYHTGRWLNGLMKELGLKVKFKEVGLAFNGDYIFICYENKPPSKTAIKKMMEDDGYDQED